MNLINANGCVVTRGMFDIMLRDLGEENAPTRVCMHPAQFATIHEQSSFDTQEISQERDFQKLMTGHTIGKLPLLLTITVPKDVISFTKDAVEVGRIIALAVLKGF